MALTRQTEFSDFTDTSYGHPCDVRIRKNTGSMGALFHWHVEGLKHTVHSHALLFPPRAAPDWSTFCRQGQLKKKSPSPDIVTF